MVNVESKDLIFLILEGYDEFEEEDEVPPYITAYELARTLGMDRSKIHELLEKLEENGLIKQEKKSIDGYSDQRKVYFLSEKGRKEEADLWDDIKNESISILTEDEKKTINLEYIENFISGRNPIVKGLLNIDEQNEIDLTEIEDETEVFVGRKEELRELIEGLKQVKQDGAQTIMIEGEAGTGKTSLVLKLKSFAKELGFEFLFGRCQSETSDPYLPLKEAFDDYIEKQTRQRSGGSMAFLGSPQRDSLEDKNLFDSQRKETFYDTTEYVRNIAEENPLMIFLDNLQWVDKATLDIWTYMDDKLEDSPVLFLGTYRPEDISKDHHLNSMIHRLLRQDRLKTVQLDSLAYEDTARIIKCVLGVQELPKKFIEIVHEKTDGNPLFIKESVKEMVEEDIIDIENDKYPTQGDKISVSDLVHNVIERRINRLSDETVRIVQIGSVIGESIPFDLLSGTVDMSDIDLLDHIDILTRNNIWKESMDEEKFFFSHELIEDTVYRSIKGLKKKLLHKKIAENIRDIYEDQLDEWYSELARHQVVAENYSEALDYYIKAGEKAENVYANEDAIELYEKALELYDKANKRDIEKLDIIRKITKAYSLIGEYEKSREYLDVGLDHTEDNEEKQKLFRNIGETYYEQADWENALDYIQKGLSTTEAKNQEKCKLLSLKGWIFTQKGDYDKAEEIFNEEKEVAEKIESEEQIGQVYHDIGTTKLRKGEIDTSIKKFEKAIEIREKTDDKIELQKSYNNIGIAYSDKGDFERSEEYYRKSLEVCENVGDKSGVSASLNNLGTIQMKKGDMEKAKNTFEESLEISKKLGDKHGKSISLTNLASILLSLGEIESAEKNLEESMKISEEIGAKNLIATIFSINGMLEKKMGDLKRAKEELRESIKICENIGRDMDRCIASHEIGEIDLLEGKYDEAKRRQLDAKEICEKLGAKEMMASTRDGLAKVYSELGEVKKAIELHEEAIEIARKANDVESEIQNLIGLSEDLLQTKEFEKAEKYSSKAETYLQNRDNPELYIRNKIITAKIKAETENYQEADKYLKEALKKSRDTKDKIWEAKSLYEYGILLSKRNEENEGRERLERAMTMFEKIGMERWKEKAKTELD